MQAHSYKAGAGCQREGLALDEADAPQLSPPLSHGHQPPVWPLRLDVHRAGHLGQACMQLPIQHDHVCGK